MATDSVSLAVEKLGSGLCLSIARELLRFTEKSSGARHGVYCPWHEEKTPGACWYNEESGDLICYSCGQRGDIIDVFAHLQGYGGDAGEGLKAFFSKYAPGMKMQPGSGRAKAESRRGWTPKDRTPQPESAAWEDKASEFVYGCADALQQDGAALGRLMRWGITPDTAKRLTIGYNATEMFPRFSAWGLPYAENANGRERCIHLPVGFVFPVFRSGGLVSRVKVRVDNPRTYEDGTTEARYKALIGGSGASFGVWGERGSRIWYVVETERDAMLLWQELHVYGIGAMCTGGAGNPPDAAAHELLRQADCIVNALDNDAAGASASWGFDPDATQFRWNTAYPHSLRWLVPSSVGKDAGDLPAAGINVAEWALAALPAPLRARCESLAASS